MRGQTWQMKRISIAVTNDLVCLSNTYVIIYSKGLLIKNLPFFNIIIMNFKNKDYVCKTSPKILSTNFL